jgi:hypothetical protein
MMPPHLGLIGREDEKPATACIVGASAMAFQKWITMAVTMDPSCCRQQNIQWEGDERDGCKYNVAR